jgi:HEAT repeat protein
MGLFKPNVKEMKAKGDIKGLIKALKDNNKGVRKAAVEALGEMKWKPKNDTEKAWYLAAKGEWGELITLGEPAVEPFVQALTDDNKGVRTAAAYALGVMKWKPKNDTEKAWYLKAAAEFLGKI